MNKNNSFLSVRLTLLQAGQRDCLIQNKAESLRQQGNPEPKSRFNSTELI